MHLEACSKNVEKEQHQEIVHEVIGNGDLEKMIPENSIAMDLGK